MPQSDGLGPTTTGPRVGYVTKMYPRLSETFIVNEIRGIENHGACVHIFSLRPPQDGYFHASLAAVRAPVDYLSRPIKPGEVWQVLHAATTAGLSVAEHLDELLQADAADAVQAVDLATRVRALGLTHLHAHFASLATTVARLAARLAGVSFTFTAHAKDIFHTDVDPADLARKMADAAAVVTVSDYNVSYLLDRYGGAADHLTRVYNGLDLDEYTFNTATADPDRIVAVGRLVEKKGFGDLLDAVSLLVTERPQLRVDIVGDGVLGPELQAKTSALGLDAHVRFLGPLPQDRTREAVRSAALLAAPCVVAADGNRDGLPTVLLEAMAQGTPVVTTPVTGNVEAVRDGETGLVVPESDPAALAQAMSFLLDRPERAREYARAARRLVEQRFDVRTNSAALWDLFCAVGTNAEVREVPA